MAIHGGPLADRANTPHTPPLFDAAAKERALGSEAASWDTSRIEPAGPGDVPLIDVGEYLSSGSNAALTTAARALGDACRNVGFYYLTGHGLRQSLLADAMTATQRFHALPLSEKQAIAMDQPNWPVGGMGYLPLKNRKLPRRATGNENEAFIVKRDERISLDDNQWPAESTLPGFRALVSDLLTQLETLALALLPIYARALNLDSHYFDAAFKDPLLRLRLTHYPPRPAGDATTADSGYGIAPHVDTTFFTLLAQDAPGLCMFSQARQQWLSVPPRTDALIVNTGELLKQWSNDEFISTRHFANNHGTQSRYAIPLFVNANRHHVMHCLPSCCGPQRPARYPPISYNDSQGVVQGE